MPDEALRQAQAHRALRSPSREVRERFFRQVEAEKQRAFLIKIAGGAATLTRVPAVPRPPESPSLFARVARLLHRTVEEPSVVTYSTPDSTLRQLSEFITARLADESFREWQESLRAPALSRRLEYVERRLMAAESRIEDVEARLAGVPFASWVAGAEDEAIPLDWARLETSLNSASAELGWGCRWSVDRERGVAVATVGTRADADRINEARFDLYRILVRSFLPRDVARVQFEVTPQRS